MTFTLDDAKAMAPENAFDVTAENYVARWKTPNEYHREGYVTGARFAAFALARDILTELQPELTGWTVATYDNEPATLNSDRVSLRKGPARIWLTCQSWGATGFQRVKFQAYCVSEDNRSGPSVEAGAALDRGAAAIAKEIKRRILPKLDDLTKAQNSRDRANRETAARFAAKLEKLIRKYPDLRIKAEQPDKPHYISVTTKYGAAISADLRIYESTDSAGAYVWRAYPRNGYALSIDDIDSKAGREFFALINRA